MKNALLILVMLITFPAPLLAHEPTFPPTTGEYLTIEENNLLLGGTPAPAVLNPISSEEASRFFRAVRDEGVEYRYVIGSCEDRAHFVSMMARKAGLSVAKVWAIAPARYTLLSQELLSIRDPAGITERVTWGHHVAPIFLVRDASGVPQPMVLDPSLSPNGLMPLAEWTSSLGTPRAKFFFTSPDNYLFKSLNNFTAWDNRQRPGRNPEPPVTLPDWFPNLLTGDFQPYNAAWDNVISTGMAQNDLAMHILAGGLAETPSDTGLLRRAIASEDAMDSLIAPDGGAELSAPIRAAVRQFFQARKAHWQSRLDALR